MAEESAQPAFREGHTLPPLTRWGRAMSFDVAKELADNWARKTHTLYGPKWLPPPFAKLAMEVRPERPNTLVVGLDDSAAEVPLAGGADWQGAKPEFRNLRWVEGR